MPHIIHMSFQKRYWNSQWTIMSTSTEAHRKYLNLELGTRLLLDLPPPASRDSPPLSPPDSTKLDFLEETLCSWFESVPASRTLTWKWRRNWMWRGAGFLTLRWKSCFLFWFLVFSFMVLNIIVLKFNFRGYHGNFLSRYRRKQCQEDLYYWKHTE